VGAKGLGTNRRIWEKPVYVRGGTGLFKGTDYTGKDTRQGWGREKYRRAPMKKKGGLRWA